MPPSNLIRLTMLLTATVLIRRSDAFNVDVSSYKSHQIKQNDSMFGFSVALHRDKKTNWWVNQSHYRIKCVAWLFCSYRNVDAYKVREQNCVRMFAVCAVQGRCCAVSNHSGSAGDEMKIKTADGFREWRV